MECHKCCASQECSTGSGVCLRTSVNGAMRTNGKLQSEESTDIVQAPLIELMIGTHLSQTVSIKRGMEYQKCEGATGQVPTADLPCELGATVIQDDTIQEVSDNRNPVFACLPSECMEKVCLFVHLNE